MRKLPFVAAPHFLNTWTEGTDTEPGVWILCKVGAEGCTTGGKGKKERSRGGEERAEEERKGREGGKGRKGKRRRGEGRRGEGRRGEERGEEERGARSQRLFIKGGSGLCPSGTIPRTMERYQQKRTDVHLLVSILV
ncbi:hypothetical protein EYF80_028166 [Liparis tanakae]|uniref:Uncharacterized protein n=1 Tax=Liparis tanakae TaxID=230148 RepID=A0A4Z2H7P4_9TELE|nr:hypothetical protein EYF80_028166 [Liparis tanakae]